MIPQIQNDRIRHEEQTPPSLHQKRKTWKGRWWLVALLIIGILLGGLTLNWYSQASISKAGDPTRTGAVTEYSFPYNIGGMGASVTEGPDGNVWFTNYAMGRIGKITPKGEMTEYTLPSDSGPTYGPAGLAQLIATGSDGNLWYAAQNKMGRITPAGKQTVFSLPHGNAGTVVSMTAGADGGVWYMYSLEEEINAFAAIWGTRIARITP